MKKIVALSLALMLMSGVAVASSRNGDFQGDPIVVVKSGGKELTVEDTPGVLYHDRTMIPLYMLRQLGAKVDWNESEWSVNVTMPKQEHELSQARLDKISKSVGKVIAYLPDGKTYHQGSGFEIDGGYFVTNSHVAHTATKLEITVDGKTYTTNGEYLVDNPDADVYIIKLDGPAPLSYVTYLPEVGDMVWSLSYPKDKFTISKGVVEGAYNFPPDIVSNTYNDHGSSGGALVNSHGEVIGITTADVGGTASVSTIRIVEALSKLK